MGLWTHGTHGSYGVHGTTLFKIKQRYSPSVCFQMRHRQCLLPIVLFAVRLALSCLVPIDDCDETLNYYEPLHYLIHDKGLQTWEYSPEFSLRSYFYLFLIGWPAFLSKFSLLSFISKPVSFYLIRLWLVCLYSLSEHFLLKSLKPLIYPDFIRYFAILSTFFVPIIKASTSFLPSASSLILFNLANASFYSNQPTLTLFFVSATVLWAWPFAGLCFLPLILLSLFNLLRIHSFFNVILRCTLVFLASFLPQFLVDSYMYSKPTVASLNIVMYNVFSSGKGPELYGVEPWYYYLLNLSINGGFLVLLTFIALGLLLIYAYRLCKSIPVPLLFFSTLQLGLPFFIWTFFMSVQPHKEERFLQPVLTSIVALMTFVLIKMMVFADTSKKSKFLKIPFRYVSLILKLIVFSSIVLHILFNLSRLFALHHNYNAPLPVYNQFYSNTLLEKNKILCLGKEWHRFQTHFFVPEGIRLEFFDSGFTGQLPQYYSDVSKTFKIQTGFNDLNLGDPERFFAIDECDYAIDLIFNWDDLFSIRNDFELIYSRPFWTLRILVCCVEFFLSRFSEISVNLESMRYLKRFIKTFTIGTI
ncbi:hypothetical protein GEMRC1_006107 [Eukaryota sp. GEM-RC1]